MQKKGKTMRRRITALVLCAVLLATSLPLALAASGTYDPAPVFDAAAREEGAAVWQDDAGGIVIRFPSATAQKTWDGAEQKTIQYYLVQLVDLGDLFSLHTETVVFSDTYSATARAGENEIVLSASEVGTLSSSHRYSVSIQAVDSENWFSEPISAIVSDVPEFVYDADAYAPLSEDEHAMREMMTFEADGNNSYVQTGDTLVFNGRAEQTGAENTSGADTTGYWFLIRSQATQSNPQTFDTSLSRQTWDYTGAEEIWFWMDFSQVSVTGLSFRLRSNEKWWDGWRDTTVNSNYKPSGTVNGVADVYGTVYSTTGYTGNDAYVLVQNTDGSWRKVSMNNGTIDLANYCGYIRVPTDFFCSETATYVNASNENFKTRGDNNSSYADSLKLSTEVLVDPAGTCVKDALLLQNRCYSYSYWGTQNYPVGTMLAAGISSVEATDAKRATVTNGTVPEHSREDNYYKAIEDILSAGFSYTGVSTDSVDKSFFLDNVMFYRTDGGSYSENTLDGNPNTGNTVATYYNQQLVIQGVILDAIDSYISEPDYSDFRAVDYVEDLIDGYKTAYAAAGVDTSFLTEENIAAAAAAQGRSATWQNFLDARTACQTQGTYGKNNSEAADLLPALTKTLEKIPAIDETVISTGAYTDTITSLYQIYRRLNLSQLTSLGKAEEEKLISLFQMAQNVLTDNSLAVGQKLADYPYIVFNDFEQNVSVGDRAYQLENDPNMGSSSDYRLTKGLVTYTTSSGQEFTTLGNGITYSAGISSRSNAMWAYVTSNGYNGSQGLTATVNSSFVGRVVDRGLTSGDGIDLEDTYHVLEVSRNSQSTADSSAFIANNMSGVNLGALANNMSNDDFQSGTYMPLSLVFYVDFTNLTNDFYFGVNIFTKDGSGNDIKARPDMGADAFIGSNTWWRMYYMLTEDGEWKAVYGDARYCWQSTSTEDASINLKGYRGYIAIPLRHFKLENAVNSEMLSTNAAALNNIYAVQMAVGGSAMDNTTYTIDNIGFTYDPVYYANEAAGRSDQSYAEIFDAKSTTAAAFEEAVAAINIYNSTNLSEQVSTVEAMYNALPDYQKQSVESVIKAKALLDVYKGYVDFPSSIPHASHTPTELAALIDALPEAAKTASVTGTGDLPNPKFVLNGNVSEVDYAAYGLTAAQAQEILTYYTDYSRYSDVEKAQLTTEQVTALMNAYRAAQRCVVTQETNLQQARDFYQALVQDGNYTQTNMPDGYTPEANENYCGSVNARDALNTVFTEYTDINYYAKYAISTGNIDAVSTRAGTSLYMWLQNTQSVALSDGTQLDAGVLKLRDEWTALYNEANTAIQNKELLSDDLLSRLCNAVEYFDALSSTYRNTTELSDAINNILKLFPAVTASLDNDTILLTSEQLTGASAYKVEYSEDLPLPTTEEDLGYIQVKSANGGLAAETFSADYNVNLTLTGPDRNYNLNTNAAALAAGVNLDTTVNNNAATPANPYTLQIDVSLDDVPIFTRGSLSDTLTVTYYSATRTDENGAPLVLDTKTITVLYTMSNMYTVTIPADVEIDWGDSNTYDVSYSVQTAFGNNATLDVGVADNAAAAATPATYALTDAASNVLGYTPANFGTASYGNTDGVVQKPTSAITVSVPDWSGVPVSEYRTTLTYTVTYHAGD